MAFALNKSASAASVLSTVFHQGSAVPPNKVPLSLGSKLAYSVGHVLNDVCASMWFTYTLIFFNNAMLFSSSSAGMIVLIGQIADGLATPFVGYCSDRSGNMWICKYGRRMTWHLIGTICVAGTFPFIFSPCMGCQHSELWIRMVYYSTFVIIFQFGWASVQISHLSMVPELTPDEHERTLLLAIRYSFTVMSNIIVYIILWIVMHADRKNPDAPITPLDTGKFQLVAYTVVVLGIVMSVIFHVGTPKEPQETLLPNEENDDSTQESKTVSRSTCALFGKIRLYQIAVLYMATRLFANLSQTLFPLYIHDNLFLGGQSIAVLPLVMYALSFAASFFVKPLNKRCGRKLAFSFGAFIGVCVSVWVRLGAGNFYKTYLIYIIAALYGITASILLITSLAITADMIGQDLDNGAFIYGLMSFCDKLSNGIFIMLIQAWTCFPSCEMHYRDSLAYVCGCAAVLGAMAVMSFCNPSTPGVEEENRENHSNGEITANA